VQVPEQLPEQVGIVHLGLGAFHRAHQAIFTEDAMAATSSGRWGVCGVTQRSRSVLDQLQPQDGLYTVLVRDDSTARARVVGSVREVLYAAEQPDAVRDRIADPSTGVLSLTVTEKGYRRGPGGHLDLRDRSVQSDLAGGPPATAVGQVVRGLQHRRATASAPLSVLSCDNLSGNGATLRGLVRDFCAALPSAEGEPLWAWIEQSARFPSTVVDRIVPATTDRDRAEATALLGLRDEGVVVAEPFRQWVIEDDFAHDRPAWEKAGAILASEVAPYEMVKLRMLNATHSLLAYTGALAGYATIASAVRDPALAHAAERLMVEDAAPTLCTPPGLDLDEYRASVLRRFANPALQHRTVQVAMDGSQKLPARLLGIVRDRLNGGAEPRWAALAVAAWMIFVEQGVDVSGRPLPLEDPLADLLRAAASSGPPTGLVQRMLSIGEVFDPELAASDVFVELLEDHVARFRSSVRRRAYACAPVPIWQATPVPPIPQ